MKQLCPSYSIAGQAITLIGVNVPQDHILIISNASSGAILYSISSGTAASYTQGTNSILTLVGSVSVSSGDKLTIYYDDGVATQNAPSSVSVSNFPATQPVSGPLTDIQLRATAVPVSGTITANVTFPATQPVSLATAPTTPVTGTFWQATQPISGTVTANTGLSQPLTDAQLRATAVPVSGTFYQVTQPVSAASLPLPTGASTSDLQTTGNSSLSTIATNTTPRNDSFTIPFYTSKEFVYTGSNITTINYYTGGSTLVAHRTLAYSGSNITSDTLSIP
jgi:hypothetical protein